MSAPTNPLINTTTESKVQESKQKSEEAQTPSTDTANTENKTNIEEKKNENDSSKKDNENENENENEAQEGEIEKPKVKRCPHLTCMKKKIRQFKKISCDKCKGGAANERVVFCLNCSKLNCSRDSENQHGLNHWMGTNNKHNLCMTIPTFEEYSEFPKDIILEMMTIWCYKCDQFLHESDQDNTQKIMKIKYEIYGCLIEKAILLFYSFHL